MVIESGKADRNNNLLKNALHNQLECLKDNWNHSYSREAVFPLGFNRRKVWLSTRGLMFGEI